MEPLTLRAEIAPSSYSEADNTVRAIWSTGAPVRRNGFIERLSLDPAHVRLDRLRGASVLDTHQHSGLRHVLGTVAECSTDGTTGHATIRLSRRSDVADIVQDIREGVIRFLSIGYAVAKWNDTSEAGERVRTAIDWEPREMSFVAIPADPGAVTRGEPMDEVIDRAAVNSAIRALRTTLPGLPAAFVDEMIDRNATLEYARSAAVEALQATQVRVPAFRQGVSHDEPGALRTRMSAALAHRLGGVELPEDAREFRSMGLLLQLRSLLQSRGEPLSFSMSDGELIQRSITTSDLPILLTETTNRLLLPAYEAAQSPLRALARTVTASDFREQFHARVSEAPPLERVAEDGEIRHGPLSESAEAVQVQTYARMIDVTFAALQNDDLGSFGRLAVAFGEAAAQAEAKAIVDLLVSNSGNGPVMSDTHNLFDATWHNNVGTPSAIDEDAIEEAVVAMRTTKGLDGETIITVTPRYLIVPAAQEFLSRKILGTVYPATTAEVNAVQGMLTVLVEPRLTDPERWYVAAGGLPVFVFANLSGFEAPQVETRELWDSSSYRRARCTISA
jgi:hypothetical protein